MPDPMTDDDLVAIRVGGFSALTPVPALLAEVHRLRDGIRTKAEAWDREEPAAEAFRVTADFRDLIGDAAWSLYERPDGLANEWSE